MSTQPHDGGRRPIDRILSPGYADSLAALPFEEVRVRRQLAEQEEADLSYARRLLQGRLDLLRAELRRREQQGGVGGPQRTDAELARDLVDALSDGPRADHGSGRHLTIDPSSTGEHRRLAEQVVADVAASDPASMTQDAIGAAVAQLSGIEHTISDSRHRVQAVMDRLTSEVARRYRDGEARVEDVLSPE